MAKNPNGRPFEALRNPKLRWFLLTYLTAMTADSIEHVVSYWVLYQRFHSATLAGFAVISHWLPFLCFSVLVGALADRVDPRRIIQAGMSVFALVSVAWGLLFVTDALEPWHAVALLLLHGCAGVLWQPASQLLLHEIVSPTELHSAVRLNSAVLYLGLLAGPAVGGASLIALGPAPAIFLNAAFYVPLFSWMFWAPYIRERISLARAGAVRGFSDITGVVVKMRAKWSMTAMTVLVGAASLFVGNSYQAQMPALAHRLIAEDSGLAYSILLAADAAGAIIAILALEVIASRALHPKTPIIFAMGWSMSLIIFASAQTYLLAVLSLFIVGFFELSFSSMAQTIIQISAPEDARGKVLGVFAMAALGCRAFSGIWIGAVGSIFGVPIALCVAAIAVLTIATTLLMLDAARYRLPSYKP